MATSSTTLHSRLKVIIAKSFRAEKLYASMKNDRGSASFEGTRVVDYANTIRAEVWQQTHYQLRKALSEIITLGNSSEIITALCGLFSEITALVDRHLKRIEELKSEIKEDCDRQEFVHCLKLSVDLVRCKSFIQVNQLIADELHEIIKYSKKASNSAKDTAPVECADIPESSTTNSNIILFQKRAAGGFRR